LVFLVPLVLGTLYHALKGHLKSGQAGHSESGQRVSDVFDEIALALLKTGDFFAEAMFAARRGSLFGATIRACKLCISDRLAPVI
jgi:hypothetical protein